MPIEHVSSLPEFQGIIQTSGSKLVVVDFFATWCGPCVAIAPFFEQLSNRYAGRARFLKVDVDDAQNIARFCSVSSMPTFHLYVQGKRVADFSGADKQQLESEIERYAPGTAENSFGGSGNRLGSDSGGAPAPRDSARESAAAAAARRFNVVKPNPTPSEPKKEPEKEGEKDPSKPKAAPLESKENPKDVDMTESKPETDPAPPLPDAPENDTRLKVNEQFLNQMTNEMGFPKIRSEKALILTGNKSLERAIEWCFEHADDLDIDEPLQVVNREGAPKVILSPEEAKKKAQALYARARAKREDEEKKEAIDRERNRLRSGKEATAAKVKLEEENRKRAVEEMRREKREALLQKQRIKQMLEEDKQRRHERFNMPGAAPSQPKPAPSARPGPSPKATAGKILFRLPDGSRIEGEFEVEQKLSDLITFLQTAKAEFSGRELQLMQQYPRKTFSSSDYGSTLGDLKLLPRGAVTVSFS